MCVIVRFSTFRVVFIVTLLSVIIVLTLTRVMLANDFTIINPSYTVINIL